jgi:hypothetical protein
MGLWDVLKGVEVLGEIELSPLARLVSSLDL